MRLHLKNNFTRLFVSGLVFLVAACSTTHPTKGFKPTYSSFDQPADHAPETLIANRLINFQGVSVEQVFKIYEGLSGRSVVQGSLPDVRIVCRNATPVNRVQALQRLDTVLAQNGIAMMLAGDNAVKAVPANQASSESPPNITLPWQLLPESSSFMSRTVQLKHLRAVEALPLLAPLAKSPNSIVAIQTQNVIILRDFSSNIRQQLQLLELLEQKSKP